MQKPCPFCGEQIQSVAVKCRYCGEWLDPSRRPEGDARPPVAVAPAPAAGAPADAWAPPPAVATPPGAPDIMSGTMKGLPVRQFYDSTHESGRHAPLPTGSAAPGLSPAPTPGLSPAPGLSAGLSSAPGLGAAPGLSSAPGLGSGPDFTPGAHGHPGPGLAGDPGAGDLAHLSSGPGQPGLSHLSSGPGLPGLSNMSSGSGLPGLSHLSPGPDAGPPRPPSSRLEDLERAFLGGGEDLPVDDAPEGDDDPFMSRSAPPPPPWSLIAMVVGGVALVGLLLFRDRLFPPETPAEDTVAADSAADAKAPPPAPVADPAPVVAPPPVAAPEVKPVAPPPPTDAAFADALAKARAAYTAGKLKPAAEALATLAKQAPDHPEVLLLTAQVQLEQENLPEAQKTAERCVAVDPKLADCWLTLGVLRQNNKDEPGAVVAYEEYLKLAPTGRYARDATSQLARLKK